MKLATKLDTLTPSFTIGISSKVKEIKHNKINQNQKSGCLS